MSGPNGRAMYQHSFTHETLSEQQWARVLRGYRLLMQVCPAVNDAPTSAYPEIPLRDRLVAWHTMKNSSGQRETSFPSPIDHDDPPIMRWEGDASIVFNGDEEFGNQPFVFSQGNTRGWKTVDTGGKPYDLMVCAMLILVNHLAPGAIRIQSESPVENWEPALTLARNYDFEIEMPKGILTRAQMDIAAFRINAPSHLDFRA